jgi:hypothetical protein
MSERPRTAFVLSGGAALGAVQVGMIRALDGGVSNNAPISHALELGAERVYVVPTGSACDLAQPPRGALGMLLHSMSLLLMQRLRVEVELLRDRAEIVVLPPPCPLGVSPIDFGHSTELVRRGLEGSRSHLDSLASGEIGAAPSGLAGVDLMPILLATDGHPEGGTRTRRSRVSEGRGEEQLLATLLGPYRPEVSCETCFEKLDRYVQIELAGGNAESVLPGVLAHLEGCLACREEHRSLHGFLRIRGER